MCEVANPEHPTVDVDRGYDLLRESCGLLSTFPLEFIAIRGEDRKAWLQGQLTNDLRQLHPGGTLQACLCSATGQLQAICRLWLIDDTYVVATHRNSLPSLIDRLEKMVIIEDVAYDSLPDWQTVSIQGPSATSWLSERIEVPTMDGARVRLGTHEVFVLRADHSGSGGWDICYPPGAKRAIQSLVKSLEPIADESLNIAQIEAGIPRFGVDTHAKTLPPELGQSFEYRTISYNKGCYTGQEVLMRIHSRGHTNQTWVGLFSEEPLGTGNTITDQNGKEVGTVTRVADSPRYGYIAAAILRNEFAVEGQILSASISNGVAEVEVRRMPLLRFD